MLPPLSQQTLVIIIVSTSIVGLIILFLLCRAFFSLFSSSSSTPLPPVQPLAHHRHVELQPNPAGYLSPPPVFSQGSKTSLLDSDVGEEQSSPSVSEHSPKHFTPSHSSALHLAPRTSHSPLNGSPSRSRSLSSHNTSHSRRSRHHTVYGTPHGPHSNLEIVLPAPLASGLHQAILDQPQKNCFVDQWVSTVAGHEPDVGERQSFLPAM